MIAHRAEFNLEVKISAKFSPGFPSESRELIRSFDYGISCVSILVRKKLIDDYRPVDFFF